MPKSRSEDKINNTFQIEQEFQSRQINLYKPPRKSKQPRIYARSGNPRTLSEEQIMLYKMRHYKRRTE